MSENNEANIIRVLVAEDEVLNQEYIKALLDCCGAYCMIVSNGQEALDALDTANFDILFLDCQMPVLDGWSTIKKIRETEKTSNHHLPVFALTGSALEGDESLFISAGMDGFIAKPPSIAELKNLFNEIRSNKYSVFTNSTSVSQVQPATDIAILNHSVLAKKYAEIPELLINLAQIFIQSSPDIKNKLNEAIILNNQNNIIFFAHKLKGMCANFGESDLWVFLDKIERSELSTDNIRQFNDILNKKFELFKREIEKII